MEGFWEAKILDLSIFFVIFLIATWKGKKFEKKVSSPDHPLGFAVYAGLGGRIIGWAEGKFGLNFKPGLKIGL